MEIEMVKCRNCNTYFPASFIVKGEGGAIVIGDNYYCSQGCAEGVYLELPFTDTDWGKVDK